MRTMAIDYGDQRIGLAVSDLLGMLAGEAWTMQEWDMERAASRIAEEAKARDVGTLVLGLPRNMDGTEGFQAGKVRQFCQQLTQAGFEVVFQDERLSTVSALEALAEGRVSPQDKKRNVDKIAASVILQQWLEDQHHQKKEG